MKGKETTMKRKLISVTLMAAVMLIPLSLTAGRPSGGGTRSTTTTWTMTCAAMNGFSGTIGGTLQLSNKNGVISSLSTACTTGGKATGTGSVTNPSAPTNFSWSLPGCYAQDGQTPVVVNGTVGTTYATYACYNSAKVIQASGQMKVVNK